VIQATKIMVSKVTEKQRVYRYYLLRKTKKKRN